jgi:hypothetical protein
VVASVHSVAPLLLDEHSRAYVDGHRLEVDALLARLCLPRRK